MMKDSEKIDILKNVVADLIYCMSMYMVMPIAHLEEINKKLKPLYDEPREGDDD